MLERLFRHIRRGVKTKWMQDQLIEEQVRRDDARMARGNTIRKPQPSRDARPHREGAAMSSG
jgi:hypothetical protein